MADIKISELNETTNFDGTEIFHCLDPFNNKATLSNIKDFIHPSNYVIVNSVDDFPDAVGGVITLENGKRYVMNNLVITSNRFELPLGASVAIVAENVIHALVYVGTGTMFTGRDFGLFTTSQATFQAPLGTFLDIDGVGSFFTTLSIWQNCAAIGQISVETVGFFYTQVTGYGDGLVFADRTDGLTRDSYAIGHSAFRSGQNNSTTVISVTGSKLDTCVLQDGSFSTGGPNESLVYFDPQLAESKALLRVNCTWDTAFGGQIFAPGSLGPEYLNASFFGNVGIQDSTVTMQLGHQNGSEVTTINTIDVREIVNVRFENQLPERMVSQDLVTFDNSLNVLTSRLVDGTTAFNHGLSDGDIITLKAGTGGSLPPEFSEDTTYFVVSATATSFQLSLTSGGPVINFSTNGTGTNYYRHTNGINAASWIVYTGLQSARIAFSGGITFLAQSGSTDLLVFMSLVKLDTGFSETTDLDLFGRGGTITVDNADAADSPIYGLVELERGESLRFYVTNTTNTTNLIATDSNISFAKA